jgi:hypothetical protein
VIRLRVVDLEHGTLGAGDHDRHRVIARGNVRAELGDDDRVVEAGRGARARWGRVEDEEATVVAEGRVERQPEQAPLVAVGIQRGDRGPQVEERLREQRAVGGDHADEADLVDHEAGRDPGGLHELDGRGEPAGHDLHADRQRPAEGARADVVPDARVARGSERALPGGRCRAGLLPHVRACGGEEHACDERAG